MRIGGFPNPKIAQLAQPTQAPEAGKQDFGKMLMDVLEEVDGSQKKAVGMQNDLMTGQPVEIHDLMIAMERASVAMNLTLQVRNKLLEAYQEISRMQV